MSVTVPSQVCPACRWQHDMLECRFGVWCDTIRDPCFHLRTINHSPLTGLDRRSIPQQHIPSMLLSNTVTFPHSREMLWHSEITENYMTFRDHRRMWTFWQHRQILSRFEITVKCCDIYKLLPKAVAFWDYRRRPWHFESRPTDKWCDISRVQASDVTFWDYRWTLWFFLIKSNK